MRVYDKDNKHITGVFQADYKGYIVSLECHANGSVKTRVQKDGKELGEGPHYMTDCNGQYIETFDSVIAWIEEDILLDKEENAD